ncbi:hypothetical protein KSZ_15370 [Dictyobacter formicarum]|uniref:Uncharacterized protein n=1 Tax=Dictyobacter formicarum TaxID=2778368 RepID=A0ABQ3VDG3_9CHLR|nr:hypothetical protein KSZ_15370 [Dictyobacter formicarum]
MFILPMLYIPDPRIDGRKAFLDFIACVSVTTLTYVNVDIQECTAYLFQLVQTINIGYTVLHAHK